MTLIIDILGPYGLFFWKRPGNFSPSFIADLAVKPRVDSQPLLAFMEQAESLTGFLGGVGLWDDLCFGCNFWFRWGGFVIVLFVCFDQIVWWFWHGFCMAPRFGVYNRRAAEA